MPDKDIHNQKKHVVSFALLFINCWVKNKIYTNTYYT